MSDDLYRRMYGAPKGPVAEKTPTESPSKLATRVLGGMKAQNSHTKVVELDGQLVNLPRAEYVKLLEDQIRAMRQTVRELESKYARTIRSMSKLQDDIRRVELELRNKVDLR